MIKYLLPARYLAVLSHLLLGGVWTIVIFTTRYFFPSDLKSIIALHAEIVILSFIVSFGFSTLVRLLVYEKKITLVREMMVFFSACQAALAFISLFFGENNGLPLATSSLYNNLFLMVNLSIARKSYKCTTSYCLACVSVILTASVSTIFSLDWLYLVTISFVNFYLFFIFYFKYRKNVSYLDFSMSDFRELLRGPTFLISGLPLRGSIFLLGSYFGSEHSSDQESILYADALIYFGVVSIFAGRYFLFNERVMKRLAARRTLLFPAYQLVLVSPFVLYASWISNVSWLVILSISALYSSREIFGLHVAFMDSKARLRSIGLYGVVVIFSFLANELFYHFYFLVPASIFFTSYYIIFRPLKRQINGSNPQEA